MWEKLNIYTYYHDLLVVYVRIVYYGCKTQIKCYNIQPQNYIIYNNIL